MPASQFLRSLVAARLAADVLDVPTVLIARTDAHSAQLLTTDIDEIDKPFCTGERTPEGFCRFRGGVEVGFVNLSRNLGIYNLGCPALFQGSGGSADGCITSGPCSLNGVLFQLMCGGNIQRASSAALQSFSTCSVVLSF